MTDIQNAEDMPQVEQSAENSIVAEPACDANESTNNVSEGDDNVSAADTEGKHVTVQMNSKAEVIERLKQLASGNEPISRQELEALKSCFYRLHKTQSEESYKKYLEEGGNPDEYMPAVNAEEPEFKEQMAIIREKRNEQIQEQEREKESNYNKKLEIIEKIKAILANPDEVNKSYNDFKALQKEWNEIKDVPAEKATDLWKTYQANVEQFYDTLKLNNEFRAYDFKKNLELKTALCEAAEKLADEPDVISAFHQLQKLHQEFREIGPVARELREEIWARFKAASTAVNKRHQEHFEKRKEQEQMNLDQKTAICEVIEGMDLDSLKTFAEWNACTEQITSLQAKWKTIGFAPQKMNVKIFERFRAACDNFFKRKSEFFKGVKDSLNANLKLKRELCEKAEALKDSTDWKATSDVLIKLQKDWKEIGTVPKKYSDALWQRFIGACDAFFEAKNKATSSVKGEQLENLEKKKALIEKIKSVATDGVDEKELREQIRTLQDEWNAIGHVPFKEKDTLYNAYREQIDRLFKAANMTASRRRLDRFKQEMGNDTGRLRDKLTRQYEILKNEIKTYENNLGFLNLSSKSGSGLVDEINRKIEKLKSDLQEIEAKIAAVDEKQNQ